MSSGKLTKSELKIVNAQIKRAFAAFNCNKQKELAEILGIGESDFTGRKGRGTLLKLIENESYRRNINFNWIETGEGPMSLSTSHSPPDTSPNSNILPISAIKEQLGHIDSDDAELYAKMAYDVLMSETGYARALKINIIWFHNAMKDARKMDEMEKRLKTLEDRLPEASE